MVLHRYWPSVHHDSHQKTRIPLLLPRITSMPIYFHPIYFHSPRLCSYPIRAFSLSLSLCVTFSHQKQARALASFFSSRLPPTSSSNNARANRASLTISKTLRFIVILISLLLSSLLPARVSSSPSLLHSFSPSRYCTSFFTPLLFPLARILSLSHALFARAFVGTRFASL